MIRKHLLVILAVLATGSAIPLKDTHAANSLTPKILSGGGQVDAVDTENAIVIIDDGVFLLAPTTRIIDARGQAGSIRTLRRGTMVNYSAILEGNSSAKPRVIEIAILPSGQKPKQNDD